MHQVGQPSAAAAVFQDNVFDLVLGGGGIKGLGHAGLLKAAWERGVRFGDVYAVSIGSLVGAIYTNGHPIDKLAETFMSELDRFGRQAFASMFTLRGAWNIVRHGGAVDIRPVIDSMIARHGLKAQPNLKIVAAHVKRGVHPHVFAGDCDLALALNASCAMPPFIRPVRTTCEGRKIRLVDGGIWHPAPHHFCARPAIIARLGLASKMPERKLNVGDLFIHMGEMVVRPVKDMFTSLPQRNDHVVIDAGKDEIATFTFNLTDEVCASMVKHGYDQASRVFDRMESDYKPAS